MASYVKALGCRHTYDLRDNPYLWFGIAWGLPVPVFSILLDLSLSGVPGRTTLDALAEHPVHWLFLAHPFLFAVVFGAMGTVRHELEREKLDLIARLTALAITDPLTGLHNRRYALEETSKAIQRSRRTGEKFGVILLDLDRFKVVNDTLGHAAGDEVLCRTASALRGVLREGDTLGRYGGDEFLLLAFGDVTSAQALLERAAESVKSAAGIGLSGGVARYPDDGESVEALVSVADSRLANIKRRHHGEEATARR